MTEGPPSENSDEGEKPRILYKYLPPARIDVLRNKRIRFTQPGDFNDPFEFRPRIQEVASNSNVRDYLAENFDRLVKEELAKYGLIAPHPEMQRQLLELREHVPQIFRLLEPSAINAVAPEIDQVLNSKVGILCLSEIRHSLLMWGHYTQNHQGFVIGFDSNSDFFSQRKTDVDEFGFLRRVEYSRERPQVKLTDTASPAWFQTKAEDWSYEKEWRMVRVLSEAKQKIEMSPLPICLFQFKHEAVREIIIGFRATPALHSEVLTIASSFPKADIYAVGEDDTYSLVFKKLN